MTIKELIEVLSKFDENLPVGSSGHNGELLNIERVHKYEGWLNSRKSFVVLSIEYAGEEPE